MTVMLERLIAEMEADRSLDRPERVRQRLEALDHLDTFDLEAGLPALAAELDPTGVHQRATVLRCNLEKLNAEFYQKIRGEIQRGAGPIELIGLCATLDAEGGANGDVAGEGYDVLDEIIAGVLQLEQPEPVLTLEAEMVNYQPTPARHIFDLLARAALKEGDVLIDLGCGLGHVPLLTAICTPGRAIGVELEPAYVESARKTARGLNLKNASFLNMDARDVDFSAGTLFYLYTPFAGGILRAVLDALRVQAMRRSIRICTFGPCTDPIAEETWLRTEEARAPDRIAILCSRG